MNKRGGFKLLTPLNETSTIFNHFQDVDFKRNPFRVTDLFLYRLKTSENQRFFYVFSIIGRDQSYKIA